MEQSEIDNHSKNKKLSPCTNKAALVEQHLKIYSSDPDSQSEDELLEQRYRFSTQYGLGSFVTPVKYTTGNRVGIWKLRKQVGERLDGKFFLCRSITPAHFIIRGIMIIVDDPKGIRALRLILWNFSSATRHDQLDEILPIGTILLIKNPLAKLAPDRGLTIGCTNPADVEIWTQVQLENAFPRLKWNGAIPSDCLELSKSVANEIHSSNATGLIHFKNLGNKSFVEKRFSDAIRFYTKGLEIFPSNIELLANRGASYINLGCFNRAMEDINVLIDIDPYHVKGIFRKVKALWGLKQFREASEFLELKMQENLKITNCKELINLKEKAETLLVQHGGEFDILDCLKKKEQLKVHFPDFAEYIGPIEKVQSIPKKGRGLIATTEIEPGQLLIASTAFACKFSFDKEDSNRSSSIFAEKSAEHEALVGQIAQMIHMEPELGREFYQLFAGAQLGILTEADIDSEIINQVDMKRIDAIVTFNSFSYTPSANSSCPKIYGVWILPSYLNHSCIDANCDWMIVGDLILIRAVRPIRKGEEILISYVIPSWEYERRKNVFCMHDFTCECQLCKLDRKDNLETQLLRELSLESLDNMNKGNTLLGNGSLALQGISILESLRHKNPKMNLVLTDPIVACLGRSLFNNGNVDLSAELMQKIHFVMKDTVLARGAVEKSVNILACFIKMNDRKLIKKWIRNVKHDLMVAYGSLEPMRIIGEYTLRRLQPFNLKFF